MDNNDFYIKQIKATIRLIENDEGNNDDKIALLLNSLLSLVVLPYEKAKKKNKKRIFAGSFNEKVVKGIGIIPLVFSPIKKCNKYSPQFSKKEITTFINKLRNGIAHQNITIHYVEDELHFLIANEFSCSECKSCKEKMCAKHGVKKQKNKVQDFAIDVTAKQLRKTALYIARSYLTAIEGEEK